MLPKLPADLPVPVVIVQHMPPKFTRSLADDLDRHCVRARHRSGRWRAAASRHGLHRARRTANARRTASPTDSKLRVTDDPPEKCCKPSVDYLFRSLADQVGSRVLAVIMTGMGDDGYVGCKLLKQQGAFVIAQDAASCVVYGMPRQIIEHGLADLIRPLRCHRRGDRSSGSAWGSNMLTSNDIDAVCGLVIDLCGVYLDESKALSHRGPARASSSRARAAKATPSLRAAPARCRSRRSATRSSTRSRPTKRCSSATARPSTRCRTR